MTDVWDRAPFDQTHLLVLLALADQANDAGRCWPSAAHIAKRARCSDRYVRQVISELQSAGWLSIEERRGRSSMYTVTTPEPRFTPEPQLRGEPQATPEKPSPLNPSSPHPGTPVQGTPELGFTQNHQVTTKEPSEAKKATRKTPYPPDWEPAANQITYADEHNIDVWVEADKFRTRNLRDGSKYANWDMAFASWLRLGNEKGWAAKKQPAKTGLGCANPFEGW